MSNVKRPFSALQDLPQVFSEPPSTTKKLKLTYDHPLKLYARLSATSTDRSDAVFVDFEDNSFTLNRTKDEFNGKESNTYDKFHFNQILNPQTSQVEIMKSVSLPLLEDLVRHDKSGVIFLYGAKSCDKTHSLLGDANDPGLLPRCLKTLLDYRTKLRQGASEDVPLCAEGKLELFEERKKVTVMKSNVMNVDFKICFEAFEICNDDIYDLLRDGKSYGLQMKQKLQLKEKDSQRVFVKDLSNIEIATDQQAIEALSRFRNKLEEDEAIFSLSGKGSKSHYVFKITAKKSQKNGFNNSNAFKGNKSYTTASLCIVQLAGSDKAKKFGGIESLNKTDTSAANANKSLTILARCLKDIKELREGQNANAHSMTNTWTVSPVGKPPMFKDSKLTRFLYEYFLEDGNLRLIAHLNTNSLDLEETTRTLNFTSQLRGYSYIEKSQGPSVAKSSVRKMLPFGENLSNNKSIVDKTNQENFKSLVSAATMRIEALVKGSDSTNKKHLFEDSSYKIRKQMPDILDEEEPNLELGEPIKLNARLQTTFMPLADVSGQENLLDDVSFADFMETEAQTNGVSSRLESELYSKMTTIQLLSLPTIAEENFVEAIQEETPVKPAEEKPAENEDSMKVSSPLRQDIVAVKESPVKQTAQEEVLELEAPISTNQSSMMTESCLPVSLFAPPRAPSQETDVMETETPSHLFESKVAHSGEVCLNLSNNILPGIPHKENPVEEIAPVVEAMETEIPKPENENVLVQNAQSEPCLQVETVAPVLDTSVLIEEKPCETVVEVVPEISCVPVLEHAAPEFDTSIIIEEKHCEKIVVQEVAQPDIIFMQDFKKISPVKPIVVEDMPSVNSSIMEAEVHIELIEDNAKSAPYRRASFDEPMKPRSKNILALNEKAASAKSTNPESSNKMLPSNVKSDFKSNTVTPKRVVSKAIITEKGNGPSSVGKENHLSMSQPHGRRNSLKTPGMTPNVGSKSKPMQAKTSVKKNEDKIRESNAKDLKIKLLEGILQKLQEKVCFKSINDKLQVINENFKKSLKGLMKPETIQSKAELFTFSNNFWATMAASAENNQAALGSLLKEADPSVPLPPINVNYFVFNGAMESEKLNSLETILKTHADNSMNQNNIFILDNNDKVLVEEPLVKIEKSAVKGRGGRKTKEKAIKQEYQEMIVEEEKQQGSRYNTRGRKKKEVELKGRTMCKLEDTPSVVILDSDNEEAKIEIEIEVISDSDDVMIIEEKDIKKDIVVKKEMVKKEIEDPKPIASRGKAKERK